MKPLLGLQRLVSVSVVAVGVIGTGHSSPAAAKAAGSVLPPASEPAEQPPKSSGFSLLPKALQRSPELEMTVFSQRTEKGRALPAPSPDHPIYYVGFNSGYAERGDVVAGHHPPDANYLGRVLQRMLLKNGYAAASDAHPPTQTLYFHWGTHNQMDRDLSAEFPELALQHNVERARLIGGAAFGDEIKRRYEFGDWTPRVSVQDQFMTLQAGQSLYYVVVSAYDYAALAEGRRELLWRANLTVNAIGVAMAESLPAVIVSAAPYFGTDTKDVEILRRKMKATRIEYGEATVLENDAFLPLPKSKAQAGD